MKPTFIRYTSTPSDEQLTAEIKTGTRRSGDLIKVVDDQGLWWGQYKIAFLDWAGKAVKVRCDDYGKTY